MEKISIKLGIKEMRVFSNLAVVVEFYYIYLNQTKTVYCDFSSINKYFKN